MIVEFADEPAVIIGGVTITMSDAIKMSIKNNFDTMSGAYDVAMTDTMYEKLQKKYAFFLNADSGLKYTENTDSAAFLNGQDSKTIDGNISLYKSFSSGTSVSVGMRNSYTKSTQSPYKIEMQAPDGSTFAANLGLPEYYSPVFFAGIQQELLKNGFGYNDRRENQMAKNTAKIQKERVLQGLSLVIVGVIVDYWSLVTSRTALENARLQLAETQNVRDIISRNVRLGLDDSSPLNYYNLPGAGAEASVITAEQKYRTASRNLLTTLNLGEETDLSGKVILSNRHEKADEEVSLKAAYDKRADYVGALLALENARMQMEMTSNASMPSVTAEFNAMSLSQSDSMNTAYSETARLAYPTFEGRLKLSYPLDDSDQRVSERNAQYQFRQARINVDKVKRTVRDDIKNRIDGMEASYGVYLKAREARVQAEQFYYKMLGNLRRGRLDSATVKNGLDAMVNSRQSEIEALVYYNISLLQFSIAKNELWEKYGINVEDYIPKNR